MLTTVRRVSAEFALSHFPKRSTFQRQVNDPRDLLLEPINEGKSNAARLFSLGQEQSCTSARGGEMNIQEFAVEHRLKARVDSCGEKIIEGRQGQIYEYDNDMLGVMFAPPSKTDPFGRWYPKVWNRLRNLGKSLGMDCRQDGNSEGCLLFDGNNRAQVKLALQSRQSSHEAGSEPRAGCSGRGKARDLSSGASGRKENPLFKPVISPNSTLCVVRAQFFS